MRVAHYLQGMKIPKELSKSDLLRKYDDLACDLFWIPNDVFSYGLERRENSHDSNLISILMESRKNENLQEAFDEAFEMTKKFIEDFLATRKEILVEFGETEELLKIFDNYEAAIVGSIEWHLYTPRYSGKKNLFKETLELELDV